MQPSGQLKPTGKLGLGCLFLFALPFAGFGIFAGVMAVREFMRGRWKEGLFLSLFALVFSGIGFGFMLGSVFGARTAKEQRAREERSPDEPWRWREDWASGRIVSTNRQIVAFAWLFALFWNGVSSSIWFILPRELEKGNRVALLALLFPLVGIGLLIWAVRATLRWRQFGTATLELAATPAQIGGQLCGLVSTQRPLGEARLVKLRLVCARHESSADGSSENLLWEEEKTLDPQALLVSGGIPVVFNIPGDCVPASPRQEGDYVKWRLEASAQTASVDFLARFDLPVFGVAATDAAAQAADDPTAVWQKNAGRFVPDPASRIRIQTTPRGEKEFLFPAARSPGVGIWLTVFALAWNAAIWFMIVKKAPLLFPIVFGLFDAAILACWFAVWFGASRVVADSGGATVYRSWLFIRRKRTFASAEVKDIKISIGMTAGNKIFYDLKIINTAGKPFTAASGIAGKREAEWLAQQIKDAVGLRSSVPAAQAP